MSARASIAATAVAAAAFTLLVSTASAVSFAYRNPALHVALETAAALIAAVSAQLVWGRFRRSLELRDLLLTCSMVVFAVTNLLFAALPGITNDHPGSFATWAPAAGRLLGAVLFAASAVARERPLRHPMRDARRLVAVCGAALSALSVAVVVIGDALPVAISPEVSPINADRPRIVGNPTVLGSVMACMLLYAVAAVGYGRLAERTGDELARWLAVAGTAGAFSSLNYVMFPSLYSPYFYTGDVLRLAFFIALAVGATLEMQRLRATMASAAILHERERIGRDIHDGVAQDLAFIVQHGRRLAGQPGANPALGALVTAAQRALDECRHAIAALTRTGDEPLAEALTLTAVETAAREGGVVEIDVDGDVTVPAGTQDALLRVTREAIINAIRHGDADAITVHLSAGDAVRLVISDDGRGFDVADAAQAPGRLGLRSMDARIRAAGGELKIDSKPAHGTRVEVTLP